MSAELLALLLRILENETVDEKEWANIRLLAHTCLISCRGEALHVLRRAEPVLEQLASGYRAGRPRKNGSPAAS